MKEIVSMKEVGKPIAPPRKEGIFFGLSITEEMSNDIEKYCEAQGISKSVFGRFAILLMLDIDIEGVIRKYGKSQGYTIEDSVLKKKGDTIEDN